MEITHTNVVDYGDAPSFIATGVRRVFLISPHIVRITFVRADMRDDGSEEHLVSGHIDWDISQLRTANAIIREAIAMLRPPRTVQAPEIAMAH